VVENAIRDPFDHGRRQSDAGEKARRRRGRARRGRIRRRQEKEISRKTAVRKMRLPGKLPIAPTPPRKDRNVIVEGERAGGSAKAGARPRLAGNPAVRGKTSTRLRRQGQASAETSSSQDLIQALGSGSGAH